MKKIFIGISCTLLQCVIVRKTNGIMEHASEKYGYSAWEYGRTEFDPERDEEHERLRQIAGNIVDCFDWLPEKEDFLLVTDTRVIEENPWMVRALEYELIRRGQEAKGQKPGAGHFRTLVTEASEKSATPLGEYIGEAMRDRPVLILTSMSRSHSKETGQAMRGDIRLNRDDVRVPDDTWRGLAELARQRRSRIVSITKGHNPYEILTKGAVFESVEQLRERAEKLTELMRNVKRMHITSLLGTDLWLSMRPDLSEIEDGKVNEPGKMSNYPIGEWSCSPDWEGSNGTFVVDGPCGGNINQDVLDKGDPLTLTIENGQVIKAIGGAEALSMWKAYLNSGNNSSNDAYRLAEVGIGINTKALEDKPRAYWGSSEGEKRYGTVHVAVGSNGSFGRTADDPNFNAAEVHCDMVAGLNSKNAVTVECETGDGKTFVLIEQGKPQGY